MELVEQEVSSAPDPRWYSFTFYHIGELSVGSELSESMWDLDKDIVKKNKPIGIPNSKTRSYAISGDTRYHYI